MPKRAGRADLIAGCDAGVDLQQSRQRNDDYELLKEQHLDLWNVDIALLTGSTVYGASIIPDPDYAAALCRAFNDWSLADLGGARRAGIKLAIGVSTSDPAKAGRRDRAQLPITRRSWQSCCRPATPGPYGNRHYHSI